MRARKLWTSSRRTRNASDADAFGARPARRLRTWDAFLVPLPFARAALVFGEPLAIGPGADAATAAPGLARALDEVTALADRRVAGAAR